MPVGKRKFSIVIPFRNEATNLENLVDSLNQIEYPTEHLEFIFVNDHSEDKSEIILKRALEKFKYKKSIIQLTGEDTGKKRALQLAIVQAKNECIITTDADCTFSKQWIQAFNKAFQPGIEFVIGPVINQSGKGILSALQEIESIMLVGITVGSATNHFPLLCSGANLAFTKELYNDLNPYDDNLSVASGDDMFFLTKVLKHDKTKINVLSSKKSLVTTKGSDTLKEMFARSIRWAGKSKQLANFSTSFLSFIVLITNCSLLILFVLPIFYYDYFEIFIKLCTFKLIVDVLLFFIIAYYYNRLNKLFFVPIMFFFYPVYLVLVAILMLITKPKWKNRNYSVNN